MSSNHASTAAPGPPGGDPNYARIEKAIAFLRAHHAEQPQLRDLAAHIHLSETHIQRLFSRWAGISPKRFLQFLTVEHAKRQMQHTGDLLSIALDSGLSGAGRLHDLFVNMEAMSPGEFRRAAAGMVMRYGFGETPFGSALVVSTPRGVCHLSFVAMPDRRAALGALQRAWPEAALAEDPAGSQALLSRIFAPRRAVDGGLSVWVGGTNFQIQVWRALLQIPFAGMLSYQQLAGAMGRPGAARAVGSAVARNRVGFLVPCHRVLRGTGEFGEYHWGTDRKAAICAWEAAVTQG